MRKTVIFFALMFLCSSLVSASFTLKWSHDFPGETLIPPVAADVDFDGKKEIIQTGDEGGENSVHGYVCCFETNGDIKWLYENTHSGTLISRHAPPEVKDLDNDGQYEVIVPAYNALFVLNAEDGTEQYVKTNINCMEKHLTTADTDHNGQLYIYVSNNPGAETGIGHLYKIRGSDGTIVKVVDIYYPCQGGLGCADLEGDGDYEIILNERRYISPDAAGKGVACFDADTLDLIWYHPEVTCSSHCSCILDVTGDGIKDVIAMDQSGETTPNGGMIVVDGSTGLKWKYDGNLGLWAHHQPTAYDIDLDGHIEVITCGYSGEMTVWDVVDWKADFVLSSPIPSKPPEMANVIGDEKLEIIVGNWDTTTYIYDYTYQQVATIPAEGYRTLTQDIDGDGKNELILQGDHGELAVYDTDAKTLGSLTNSPYHGEGNTGAEVYFPSTGGVISENAFPTLIFIVVLFLSLFAVVVLKRLGRI